jgi:hypothetical protein
MAFFTARPTGIPTAIVVILQPILSNVFAMALL